MKPMYLVSLIILCCLNVTAQHNDMELGLNQTIDGWKVAVWSSQAIEMRLHVFTHYNDHQPMHTMEMSGEAGFWIVEFSDTLTGRYFTVQAKVGQKWMNEVVEPYAKMVSVNGKKGYIGLPGEIAPEGWSKDHFTTTRPRDAVIYELQVRDFSMGAQSLFSFPGKFMAFTEVGLQVNEESVGLDHLKEMGITHVHLLPIFDFRSVDETRLHEEEYNWGYDPLNYNVPEGSFSTNPYEPHVRVLEFKKLVLALHKAGIGVIMDVVYNHTGPTLESSFNQVDPGYYYRSVNGKFSNASACGNETASEQPMMRRFMIESMAFWMSEYHVDGFRVDLMGIHDIETMNQVKKELQEINPYVLLYGEGWAAGESPLSDSLRALKKNTALLDDIAVFSDEFRDALKGHWNTHSDRGFITGKHGQKESIKFGLVGGVAHSQVAYDQINYTGFAWAERPTQMIAYVSCHDGMTLYDKIRHSQPGLSDLQYQEKQKLAATMVLTSQGIPFLHAGMEFLRTKHFVDNSFESPDRINAIDWSLKSMHRETVAYFRGLIQMRKTHEVFRLGSAEAISNSVTFPETGDPLLLVYQIDGSETEDEWKRVILVFNGDLQRKSFTLPLGVWYYAVDSGSFLEPMRSVGPEVTIEGSTASILYQLSE